MQNPRIALFLSLMILSPAAWTFPEMPFCPLGGPGGWMDRLFDDDDRPPPWFRHPPPGYYAPHPLPPFLQRSYPRSYATPDWRHQRRYH